MVSLVDKLHFIPWYLSTKRFIFWNQNRATILATRRHELEEDTGHIPSTFHWLKFRDGADPPNFKLTRGKFEQESVICQPHQVRLSAGAQRGSLFCEKIQGTTTRSRSVGLALVPRHGLPSSFRTILHHLFLWSEFMKESFRWSAWSCKFYWGDSTFIIWSSRDTVRKISHTWYFFNIQTY